MRFKKTYLRKNKIVLPANVQDTQEYAATLVLNGVAVGVPLYQIPFEGRINWRVESLVKGLPFTSGFFPDADRTDLRILKDYSLKLQLRFQRADGAGSESQLPDFVVSKAGVSDHYFNRRENPLNEPSNFAKRLTYQPNLKRISMRQPEFIYFWNNRDPAVSKINVTITIRFTDGTQVQHPLHSQSIAEFDLVVINVSPIICEEFLLGRELSGYDIHVADSLGTLLFETHTYEIDTRPQLDETFIVFENSFGVFDTLRFFGNKSESESVERSYFENENGKYVFDVRGRRRLLLNTGFQEQNMKQSLSELIYSSNVYIFDGLDSIPVNVLTDSAESFSTNSDDSKTVEFEYITEDTSFQL